MAAIVVAEHWAWLVLGWVAVHEFELRFRHCGI